MLRVDVEDGKIQSRQQAIGVHEYGKLEASERGGTATIT